MKNRILILILICLSLALIYSDKGKYQNFLNLSIGNIQYKSKKYHKARDYYIKINDKFDLDKVNSNVTKTFYEEQNYSKVLEEESKEFFLRGNSDVKLGDLSIDNNKDDIDFTQIKTYYEDALGEYKNMMLLSSDINVKKNYEIVKEKLTKLSEKEKQQEEQNNQEENKENEQQDQNNKENNNQENQDNQEQNQQNDNQNQDNQDKNQQNSNQDRDNQSDKSDENQKDQGNQESQENKNQNQQNDSQNQNNQDKNQQNSNQGQDSQSDKTDENQKDQGNQEDQDNKEQKSQEKNNQTQTQNHSEQNNTEDERKADVGENASTKSSNNQEVIFAEDISDNRKDEIKTILKRMEGSEGQSFKNNERVMPLGDDRNKNRW